MNRKTDLYINITICFVAVIIGFIIYKFNIPCIFRHTFHFPCMGCGLSRAGHALIEGNFEAAWNYHPMIYSLPLVILLILRRCNVFRNNILNILLAGAIFSGFVICYILRFFGFLYSV